MFSSANIDYPWTRAASKNRNDLLSLCFKNQLANEALETIEVCRRNEEYFIELTIAKSKYKEFVKCLKEKGYPSADCVDRCQNIYSIPIPNVKYLTDFLRVINLQTNGMNKIFNKIINEFTPYSFEEPTIPGWSKHKLVDNSTDYQSCIASSKLKFINIRSVTNGEYRVSIKARKKNYNELENLLKTLSVSAEYHRPISFCQIKLNSSNQLRQLFMELCIVDPNVNFVADYVIADYTNKTSTPNPSNNGIFKYTNTREEPQYNINGECIDSPAP